MKKKAMALTVAAMMAAAMITGCGQTAATTVETAADTTVQTEESTADTESNRYFPVRRARFSGQLQNRFSGRLKRSGHRRGREPDCFV